MKMGNIDKLFIAILLLIIVQLTGFSKAYGQISLDYGEFGIFFKPEKGLDTLEFTLTKFNTGFTLKLYLKDFGGASYIELYNKKHQLKETGYFVNGPDTLVKYSYSKQLGPPFDKKYYGVRLIKYLSPLKRGLWTYYDDKGNLINKSEYDYNFY